MDQSNSDLQYLFIINPTAGRKHLSDLAHRIEEVFVRAGRSDRYSIVLTDRGGNAMELAADFARKYGDKGLVVSCGGDGTANETANALSGTQTAMTILPTGTANDFARAVLSGKNPAELLEKILNPTIRPIDVIQVDDKVCLNIMSFGFDTKIQRKAGELNKRYRKLGSFSYPLAIFLSLWGKRDYRMRYRLTIIKEDNTEQELNGDRNYILAAVCNGQYYGGGFNPAPGALVDDGVLNVCMVDVLPLARILMLIGKYKKGTHLGHPAIHSWNVRAGHLYAPEGVLLMGNMDGELFNKQELSFEVKPANLRFAFY